MEKHLYGFSIIIASLTLISFSCCLTAEFKKTKKKDLKLNGKLCFLPQSEAFELGIASLGPVWVSFGISIAMMSGATSLGRRQDYRKGWLEEECYLVKDGIFVASSLLVLISVGSTLASAAIGRTTLLNLNSPTQIHAQLQTG